ncbi:MAG TPA: hypothetical protein DDY58_11355 [Terrisporobacter glycolicus]|uniref:Uncharacterized protein n=1 Tax=Terrisporobacter petrolearius TaxID=1460447 RepID=A0ABZ3FEP1_9FIRM|nr:MULTISPECIES: hypothetical protein [Terrisporobacter]MBN9646172.1 hypothetical protein [Terrisporobacter glycolicus]HBI92955.1 hypothetical protein [Terrisporobacter hibernicus]
MKENDFKKIEIEKLNNKICVQCYKSIFTIDNNYIDKLSIISPFETVDCNIKVEIIVDNKKIKEVKTKLKFNQEYSYDFYDANFSYIVNFDIYLEWICESIDTLLFEDRSEYCSELKRFVGKSKIIYKIDIIDIEIDRKIENNILSKWKNIIKNTYNEMDVNDILDDIDMIKENYDKKLLGKSRDIYINKEEYKILNEIELAVNNRKEIVLNIKDYRQVVKEIKSSLMSSKNIIIIKSKYNGNILKATYKLRDVEILLSSEYLTIKNKHTNFLYKEETSGIYFKIRFDEEKVKICKNYDDCNKIIIIKDDNIEIEVILNQE